MQGGSKILRWLGSFGALLLLISYLAMLAWHLEPLAMQSGSMAKTIPVGSLVLDREQPANQLKVGQVISFQKLAGTPGLDSHRIVKIAQADDGSVAVRTQGDNNPVRDPWTLIYKPHQSAHVMVFSVPYLGKLFDLFRIAWLRLLIIACSVLTILVGVGRAIVKAAVEESVVEDSAPPAQPALMAPVGSAAVVAFPAAAVPSEPVAAAAAPVAAPAPVQAADLWPRFPWYRSEPARAAVSVARVDVYDPTFWQQAAAELAELEARASTVRSRSFNLNPLRA